MSAFHAEAGRAGAAPASRGVVRVVIGEVLLALPEGDVASVESALDVRPSPDADDRRCGSVAFAGREVPVFALDASFGLLAERPERCRACLVLPGPAGHFAMLADAVTRLGESEVRREPLPACMGGAGGPFESLVIDARAPLLAVSAASLGGWLAAQGALAAGEPRPAGAAA